MKRYRSSLSSAGGDVDIGKDPIGLEEWDRNSKFFYNNKTLKKPKKSRFGNEADDDMVFNENPYKQGKKKKKTKKNRDENIEANADDEYQYGDNPYAGKMKGKSKRVPDKAIELTQRDPSRVEYDENPYTKKSKKKSKLKSKQKKSGEDVDYSDNPYAGRMKSVRDMKATNSAQDTNFKLAAEPVDFGDEYDQLNDDKSRFGYNQFAGASKLRKMPPKKSKTARESSSAGNRDSAVVDWKKTYRDNEDVSDEEGSNRSRSRSGSESSRSSSGRSSGDDSSRRSDDSDYSNRKYKYNPMIRKK